MCASLFSQRPYAFIKFDTFIQKTRKLYLDTRTQRNLTKLNDDLMDIQTVMTRNIQDILGQGEKLDHVTQMSDSLKSASRQYSAKAKDLSRQAMYQKYMPIAVIALIVVFTLLIRHYFF